MKKIAIALSVMSFGAASLMAQGNFIFENVSPFQITIQDTSGTIDGGAAVDVGTPANTAGFTGAGPGQIEIELFVAANGTLNLSQLLATTPVATTLNFSSSNPAAQGLFNGGNPLAISQAVGTTVEWAMVALNNGGVNPTYSSLGNTTLQSGYALTQGTTLPNATFGTGSGEISGLQIVPVPEPSTFVLGGLGAAALAFFRRRK